MFQKPNEKIVCIPEDRWRKLSNSLSNTQKEFFLEKCYSARKYESEKNHETTISRDGKIENINDFIVETRKKFESEKPMSLDVKRAAFLSNVFTERSNQLKFRKLLQQLHKDKMNKENERFAIEERMTRQGQLEEKEKNRKSKWLLNERLKNELRQLELCRKEKEKLKREQQIEELRSIENRLRKDEDRKKNLDEQLKRKALYLHLNDLHQKHAYLKKAAQIELEESNFATVQDILTQARNTFIKSNEDTQRKRHSKEIAQIQSETPTCSYLNKKEKSREVIPRLKLPGKSSIEKKREIYNKKLREERINIYKNQMKELDQRRTCEKRGKNIESEQTLKNLKVTQFLENQKFRENMETIKAYRNTWNKQVQEKDRARKQEKLQDIRWLEKLQNDMRKEDEDFLTDVKIILCEYANKNKNTLPLIKCIQDFERKRHPLPTQRNKILLSQIPI